MNNEQKLLAILGRKMLNLYFAGCSPVLLYRLFGEIISSFLDETDDFDLKKEA